MRAVLRGSLVVAWVLAVGCATGEGGGDGGADVMDGGGQGDAGTIDAGGGGACPTGQHRCGAGCIDDLENLPENGCRLGCGEPCPTPSGGAAACDEAGMCTLGCEPPFHMEDGECVCAPRTCEDIGYQCGAPDDGCGTPLDCGACDGDGVCTDGLCSCPKDEREPNDSTLGAVMLGTMRDADDETRTWNEFNLHSARDEDWFKIEIRDEGWLGNPEITVTLDEIPPGSDYDLSAWYVCAEGGDQSSCTVGSPCSGRASGTTDESIFMNTDCARATSTDDSGTLWIRIQSASWGGSCAPYRLQVHVTQ